MNPKTIALTVLGVVTVVSVIIFVIKHITKKKGVETNNKTSPLLPEKNNIVLDFLKETDEIYSPKFLSYYIYKYGKEQKLSIQQLRQLDKEYGESLAEPVIDWPKLISKLNNQQVDILLDTVEWYIKQNSGEVSTGNYEDTDLFEKYLKDRASIEATEIVAKVSQ